jgi:hypothetical protein
LFGSPSQAIIIQREIVADASFSGLRGEDRMIGAVQDYLLSASRLTI